jgi:hypothetical protein
MAFSSPLVVTFLAIALLALLAFVYFSFQMHRVKGSSLSWRGIIKLVSLNGVPADMSSVYRKWFVAFAAVFIFGCLAVSCLVWGSDHSFLIVIFPLLFYYFFARFFLWEKADLSD